MSKSPTSWSSGVKVLSAWVLTSATNSWWNLQRELFLTAVNAIPLESASQRTCSISGPSLSVANCTSASAVGALRVSGCCTKLCTSSIRNTQIVSSGAFKSSRPRSVTTARYRPSGEYLITPPGVPCPAYSNNVSPTSSAPVNRRPAEPSENAQGKPTDARMVPNRPRWATEAFIAYQYCPL